MTEVGKFKRLAYRITFPGKYLHEFAHVWACKIRGIPVEKVSYRHGYVRHWESTKFRHNLSIAMMPLWFNTFLSVGFYGLGFTYEGSIFLKTIFIYLGFSFGFCAIPSLQDVGNVWSSAKKKWYHPFVWIVMPFTVVIWIMNKLRWMWIEFLYSLVLMVVAYGAVVG